MIKSIACNIKCLAENILDPHIINPLPSIRRKAENIYQEFISSDESKNIYDMAKKNSSGNVPCMVEEILTVLRDKINEAAQDDPNKFQLLRAYVRDKIFDGMV